MNAARGIGLGCLAVAMLCSAAWSQATRPATAPASQNAPQRDFTVVGDAALDKRGFISWMISSPYQEGPNAVEVLCPDDATRGPQARYPVIYFLQVGPDFGAWGNPIVEARNLNLHNKHKVIFVLTAFKAVKSEEAAARGGGPWYADHPTNPKIRPWRSASVKSLEERSLLPNGDGWACAGGVVICITIQRRIK